MFSQPEIIRILEVFIYEQNRVQTDDPAYFKYTDEMKAANLSSMTASDSRVIQDFLFKWGHMQRTGIGRAIPNVANVIQPYAGFLERVRHKKLYPSDLRPDKQTIEDLFEGLYSLVKAIATSKILHLICPDFFPLWDNLIIIGYNSSYKAENGFPLIEMVDVPNKKGSKRPSGKGYYDFMEVTESIIEKYHDQLSQIQAALRASNANKKEKSLLKIIDEFNMLASHAPFWYLL